MSWLEVRSKGRYNRRGYLVFGDGSEKEFKFAYRGESGVGSPETIPGVETEMYTLTFDTPTDLPFTLSSKIRIDGALYSVSSIQELEASDCNGPFRGKGCRIRRITASKLI